MNPRVALVLIGVLGVGSIGLVLSAVAPLSTAAPHAAEPADERFTVGNATGYRAAGRIVVDGEVALGFEGIVAPDGRWYQRVTEAGITDESYRPTADGPVYRRLEFAAAADAERRHDMTAADGTRELLRYDRAGGSTVLVVREDARSGENPVAGTATVIVRSLDVAGYEPKRANTGPAAVYEPQSGWYGASDPYRLTAAAGTVRVAPGTRAVVSANVTWDLTVPAGSYAEYLLGTLTTDDPRRYVITFQFDPAHHEIEPPGWVNETRAA